MKTNNKVAFITGASSGIGRATALLLAREKFRVGIFARRRDRLESLAGKISAAGSEADIYAGDVADRGAVFAAVKKTAARFGRLDVLLANAGYGLDVPVEKANPDDFRRIFEVNLMGCLHAIQACLPYMKRQRSGHIIIVSSIVGKRSMPGSGGYCMTKFAQIALAESLRLELDGTGIKVTLVYPGSTATGFHDSIVRRESRNFNPPTTAQPAEHVARCIYSAIRRPRLEIYPYKPGYIMAVLNTTCPGMLDFILKRMIRR